MQILRSAGCMLVTLLLVFLAAWVYLRSGRFDVAAEQPQSGWSERTFTTVRERSVARAARGLEAPAPFDAATVAHGALIYADSCEICHGGPGRQGEPFAYGLHPVPPSLDGPQVQDRRDGELYWTITHGLRFTGMPAFVQLYDQDDRWALVAFLRRLPELMPNGYETLVSGGEAEEGDEPYLDETP